MVMLKNTANETGLCKERMRREGFGYRNTFASKNNLHNKMMKKFWIFFSKAFSKGFGVFPMGEEG